MKKNWYKIYILAAVIFSASSCSIKEDMDDCYVAYLEFECINSNYLFPEVTDELELLFYNQQGELVYNYTYSAQELQSQNWVVRLSHEKPGEYTLLAHVNYNNDHTFVSGKEKKETLETEIEYDSDRRINYPLTDTYYGHYELNLDYSKSNTYHKVMLSKNTNFINLTLTFENENEYRSVTEFSSDIKGKNALYGWDNKAPEHPTVEYIPFRSSFNDSELRFNDFNKTMRIWTTADLELIINIEAGRPYSYSIDIPKSLAEIENNGQHPYDSDEKLEYYDEFDFEIIIGSGFTIIAIKINGWYTIGQGVGI